MRHHLFCCGGRGGPTGRSGYGRPGVRVASRRRWRVGQGECVGGGSVRASAAVTGPSGSGPSSRAPSPYAGPRPARSPASGRQAPPRPRGRGPADDVRDESSNDPPAAANGPRAASRAVLRVGHVRPLPHRGARRTDPTPAQRHRGPGVTRARSPGRRASVPRGGDAEGGEVPCAVRTGCRACRARTVRPYRVRVPAHAPKEEGARVGHGFFFDFPSTTCLRNGYPGHASRPGWACVAEVPWVCRLPGAVESAGPGLIRTLRSRLTNHPEVTVRAGPVAYGDHRDGRLYPGLTAKAVLIRAGPGFVPV